VTIALRTDDLQVDPLDDLTDLLAQLRERHMLGTRSYFTSYLILADAATSAEDVLGTARESGWETASYATPEGLVLRLSTRRRVTVARLEADSAAVRELARTMGARWFGFAVEDLDAPSRWDELAQGLRDRPSGGPQG
jgi:hypothetical protein